MAKIMLIATTTSKEERDKEIISAFNEKHVLDVLDGGKCFSSLRNNYSRGDNIVYVYFRGLYKEAGIFPIYFNDVFNNIKIELLCNDDDVFLFKIIIEKRYKEVPRFILSYIIPCIIRIFSLLDFKEILTEERIADDVISAIVEANDNCTWGIHAVSEVPLRKKEILFLDDISLMNKFFDGGFINIDNEFSRQRLQQILIFNHIRFLLGEK